MRFLLVIAIWIVIVGGLYGYVTKRDARRLQVKAPVAQDIRVGGNFSIEFTPTFSIEKDPFALTTSGSELPPVEIRLNGVALGLETNEIGRGVTQRLSGVSGILEGHNEIYVSASPPVSEDSLEHGIRVKLLQDRAVLVDKTLWSEQGSLVAGTVSFMHLKQEEEEHDH